jgi:hypothetical protein
MKAAMMMRAEKKMALSTSPAARSTISDRPESPRAPGGGRRRLPAGAGEAEVPVDVLHHDDGGVHQQPEVERAEGQQVGALAAGHHQQDGEEEGEGDGRRHHQRPRKSPRNSHWITRIRPRPR